MPTATQARDTIAAAIAAHDRWKARLQAAMQNGGAELDLTTVRRDDQCDFGRWLYQQVDPTLRANPRYQKIRQLHAAFHTEAGKVVELIKAGKNQQATAAMSGPYMQASGALAQELVAWQPEVN